MHKKEYSIEIGGKTMTAEFNDWANQTNGSVLLRYGNSVVLATAVLGERESAQDYFPLSVEYEEKFYAAGAILGSQYMRREGRPSEEAILGGRIVDRTIRPLFDQHIRRDVQVIISVLSLDEDDTDVMGIVAASLALATSDIPWNGPVGADRIGRVDGSFIINPTYKQRADAKNDLDLLVCGKDGMVNMIEVASNQVTEPEILKGFEAAIKVIDQLQKWQEGIVLERGTPKQSFPKPEVPAPIVSLFESTIVPQLETAIFGSNDGVVGKENINQLKSDWMKAAKELIKTELLETKDTIADHYFEDRIDAHIHTEAIKNDRRADGRSMTEIRPLFAQAGGISPMIHGTGVFYRGGTHVLSALTLGGPGDAQTLDTIEHRDQKKQFMHHYNFPPFSVGETGRVGGTNRRMIGHGALAEKALKAVLPEKNSFPYTIRIVSEC
jgi:polyribonucleotide nucleotidyltransferase